VTGDRNLSEANPIDPVLIGAVVGGAVGFLLIVVAIVAVTC
jgi:hypothetical protein